jgi:hypothetical protein
VFSAPNARKSHDQYATPFLQQPLQERNHSHVAAEPSHARNQVRSAAVVISFLLPSRGFSSSFLFATEPTDARNQVRFANVAISVYFSSFFGA